MISSHVLNSKCVFVSISFGEKKSHFGRKIPIFVELFTNSMQLFILCYNDTCKETLHKYKVLK